MDSREDRPTARRAELEDLVPGSGIGAMIDRGAWVGMSQGAPGTWSWGKAGVTVVVAAVAAAILYATVYSSIDWVIGLALAYLVLLWRARKVHADYLARRG